MRRSLPYGIIVIIFAMVLAIVAAILYALVSPEPAPPPTVTEVENSPAQVAPAPKPPAPVVEAQAPPVEKPPPEKVEPKPPVMVETEPEKTQHPLRTRDPAMLAEQKRLLDGLVTDMWSDMPDEVRTCFKPRTLPGGETYFVNPTQLVLRNTDDVVCIHNMIFLQLAVRQWFNLAYAKVPVSEYNRAEMDVITLAVFYHKAGLEIPLPEKLPTP